VRIAAFVVRKDMSSSPSSTMLADCHWSAWIYLCYFCW